MGQLLVKHNIELVPKFENHDAMHVLTNIGITLLEEIALKCYLLGNGRLSLYHLLTTVGGVVLYPQKIPYFMHHYRKGKRAKPFHHIDFEELLGVSVDKLRRRFSII